MGSSESRPAFLGRLLRRLRESRELARFIAAEPEARHLRAHLRADAIAVDVGAHRGRYTALLARGSREVVVFEPIARLADEIALRYRDRVRVHRVAISDQEGTADFHLPSHGEAVIETRASLKADANPGFALETISVPVRTLDSYGLENVSVLKIDVEGLEANVLRGAEETIRRNRPVMLVEIEDRHNPGTFRETIALATRFGHRGYFLLDGRLRPIEEFDLATHQNIAHLKAPDAAASGLYVNNFLFLPDGTDNPDGS